MTRKPTVLVAKKQGRHSPAIELPDATVDEVSHVPALQKALAGEPDVALISLDLPGLGGAPGLRSLSKISPRTKMVALTRQANDEEELNVLRTGARGYTETDNTNAIPKVVEKVDEGEVWAARRTIGRLLDEIFSAKNIAEEAEGGVHATLRQQFPKLTPREQEILQLLGEGLSNKEIASASNVTVATVKAHLTKIFRKLGQPDRLHLALAARGTAEK